MIPTFHHILSKQPFEVDLKWNLFKWNWLLLRILSSGLKVFYIKKEKNSLSDLYHNVRKSLSANESFYLFFYIRDCCRDVCCSVANFVRLTSVFELFL